MEKKFNDNELSFLAKAKELCAKDEQCATSVLRKLVDWGCPLDSANKIVANLYATSFIDDNRFVRMYCDSKVRHQKWGRIKITAMLRQKHIAGETITRGIKQIDEQAYREVLHGVAEAKWPSCQVADPAKNRQKLIAFLLSRGYELEVIQDVIKDIVE